jgi:hypothetical protein
MPDHDSELDEEYSRIRKRKRRDPQPEGYKPWEWYQHINRYWMKHLTASEFMAVMFILDRTLGWQKEAEVITRKHFLEGIVSGRYSRIYHSGTSLSASTIDNVLNSLEKKKVIIRQQVKRGTTRFVELSINFRWSPPRPEGCQNDLRFRIESPDYEAWSELRNYRSQFMGSRNL